jgi:hypothetical protein
VILFGFSQSVSWLILVLLSGSFVMVYYVSLLVIHFALSYLVILLHLFMLCYPSYTRAPWLDILEVRNYLSWHKNIFSGRTCMVQLSSLFVVVLCVLQTRVVLRKPLVCLFL